MAARPLSPPPGPAHKRLVLRLLTAPPGTARYVGCSAALGSGVVVWVRRFTGGLGRAVARLFLARICVQ